MRESKSQDSLLRIAKHSSKNAKRLSRMLQSKTKDFSLNQRVVITAGTKKGKIGTITKIRDLREHISFEITIQDTKITFLGSEQRYLGHESIQAA